MRPANIREFGRACEAMGVDLLTVGEAASEFRDPFVNLVRLAEATERPRLTTAVTTPRLRHPAVLANAFATVDEVSKGRVAIGLGSGDLGLMELGEKPVRLAELEEYATTVKTLANGGAVDAGDRTISIRWADADMPLWLAADGPKMLALAARIADGVIVG
jgi:5,10-methylenetetrahydromethanopterin reductase